MQVHRIEIVNYKLSPLEANMRKQEIVVSTEAPAINEVNHWRNTFLGFNVKRSLMAL